MLLVWPASKDRLRIVVDHCMYRTYQIALSSSVIVDIASGFLI